MSASSVARRSTPAVTLTVHHQRHPGRWVATVVILLLTAMLAKSLVTNPRYHWDVVGEYLFSKVILHGLGNTIRLTVLAMIAGTVLGTILAVLRLSPNPLISKSIAVYVWFFRATPLLVQLLFWFNLAALYPEVSIGIPFGPPIVSAPADQLINIWTAALLGLSLHQAAYTAEIVRAGIVSVDPGQRDAAAALGMPRLLTLRRIVLPQAMRAIVPPMGNEVISMMKTTSLVSIIALPELLNSAQTVYARTYQTVPLLLVATFWYLVLTATLSVFQSALERRYGRGTTPASGGSSAVADRWRRRRGGPPRTDPRPDTTGRDA